ncbi:MAG: hypothetical protein LBP63_05760 [Prevotellaceae bacterium]|jgi:hypothetical protein|nr:hypothetical protein [Prevotellaceae bacterium]
MKNLIYLTITLFIATCIFSCTNENNANDLELLGNNLNGGNTTLPGFIGGNSDWQKWVSNTYTADLPDGVDSIQMVTNEHPLYANGVLKSPYVTDKDLDEDNLAIYYYSNNKTALLARNNLDNIVYTYMIASDTKDLVDVFVITKQENSGSNQLIGNSYREIQLFSSIQNTMLGSYNGEKYILTSWGSRFGAALKQLYDDWDDDPVGSLACCVTTVLCAAAAAIWALF